MPRQAAAAAGFPSASVARLRPPDDLLGPERTLFVATVIACRADHFQACDMEALLIYVRACVRATVANAELTRAGYVDAAGKASSWMQILVAAERTASVYSRLLKLNPVARQASEAEPPPPPPFFERQELEKRRNGEH